MAVQEEMIIRLPVARIDGTNSIESLLYQRRSRREFRDATIILDDVGQLLWSAQGITHPQDLRTAPSAGALYPLELYVVVGKVKELAAGVYHYKAKGHQLVQTDTQDQRDALARAAMSQNWLAKAAAVLVIAAAYERTTWKYGERGIHYVHMEVGHAAQNVFLQAEALGLATVVVGAFDDGKVAKVLNLPSGVQPLALMPIGNRP